MNKKDEEVLLAPDDLSGLPEFTKTPQIERKWVGLEEVRLVGRFKGHEITLLSINDGPLGIELTKYPRVIDLFDKEGVPGGAILVGSRVDLKINKLAGSHKFIPLGSYICHPDGVEVFAEHEDTSESEDEIQQLDSNENEDEETQEDQEGENV